ncbi:hypothetical protein [Microbacterium sp. MMO-113]|uniref:hypothetical protein n=1 Tax=Microbacterium sp. MMO-113 TaxID=3081273 RepID=UPI003017BF4C
MAFLSSAAQDAVADASGSGVELWAAGLSLLTALVVTVGPSVVRKLFPPDSTVADIAKSSTERIANSLDATLKLVKDDLGAMRAQIDENGRKLDVIGGKGRR